MPVLSAETQSDEEESVKQKSVELKGVERYRDVIDGVQIMSSGFMQRVVDTDDNVLQESEGRLVLKQGGHFFWQTFEPFPQTIISNTKTLWLYDPDLEQVVVKKIEPDMLAMPILLLTGSIDELKQNFDVRLISDNKFSLWPKQSNSVYQNIVIAFSNSDSRATVSHFFIQDNMGQETQLFLNNVQLNDEVDLSLTQNFEFQTPEGVEVLNE